METNLQKIDQAHRTKLEMNCWRDLMVQKGCSPFMAVAVHPNNEVEFFTQLQPEILIPHLEKCIARLKQGHLVIKI